MKQKSFLTPKSIHDLILDMIAESDRRVEFLLSNFDYCLDDEIGGGFQVIDCYNHYFKQAEQGLITQEFENNLVRLSQEIPNIDFPVHEAIADYASFNVFQPLSAQLELFAYYCSMAMYFEINKKSKDAQAYALKASEADGRAYQIGLHYFIVNAVQENTLLQATQIRGRKRSKLANSKKSVAFLVRVKFAKEKWLEMPAWHTRSASETADKLIKEHGKHVPAKDKLTRLISEWKQQLKK